MTTITIADVLRNIDRQLQWRGSNDSLYPGKQLDVVVMARDEAQYLRDWCILLCKERDELVFKLELMDRIKPELDAGDE